MKRSVPQLLRKGLDARNAGQWAAAREAYLGALIWQPEHPDALQLLGELAQAQGDLVSAHDWLMRSLRACEAQPQVWSRLAAVQEDLGHRKEAQASLQRALALAPAQPDVLYNSARLLRALGRSGEADQHLTLALACARLPATLHAQMLQLQALLHEDAGDLALALAALDQALLLAPKRAALHHNRGVLLQRRGRPAEALQALDLALALGLESADAHYNRGNSLQSLGKLPEALVAYGQALARDAQHALALFDVARLRWRMGNADFMLELDTAAASAPQSAVALGIKGRLLLRADRHAEAAQAFAEATARDGNAAGYFDGMGQALAKVGRYSEALNAHRRAVELAPQDAATHISHATTLLQAGDAIAAEHAAMRATRLEPCDQMAWATLGVAWRVKGDPRERWLNGYLRHVQVFDLAPPAGWDDIHAFNIALATQLQALHHDAEAPVDQTLRHGSQTFGTLFEQAHPLVAALRGSVTEAMDRYVADLRTLPADPSHPLLGRLSQRWRFTDSWSSRLRSGGFHTHHVHSHGWISSCYYVALPPAIDCSGNGRDGWITFGTPDFAVPGHPLEPQRVEQPKVGRLVLFPSFLWHGTVPFNDEQPRLTIAFDALPLLSD